MDMSLLLRKVTAGGNEEAVVKILLKLTVLILMLSFFKGTSVDLWWTPAVLQLAPVLLSLEQAALSYNENLARGESKGLIYTL